MLRRSKLSRAIVLVLFRLRLLLLLLLLLVHWLSFIRQPQPVLSHVY